VLRLAFVVACLASLSAPERAEAQEKVHLEGSIGLERWYAWFETPNPPELGGGVEPRRERYWSAGVDLCPLAVIRPWLDLGGCVGLQIIPGAPDREIDTFLEDTTTWSVARVALRSTFRAARYFRAGIDLGYRAFLLLGARESALETMLRVGGELETPEGLTFFVELVSRIQLVGIRSTSVYTYRRGDDEITSEVESFYPFSIGVHLGMYWRL
jgi:hypothetical protein